MIYLDGAGCYGMNGHDDAAADAALLSRAVGRPVRVQWMREDEHGWDPKGPPQLLDIRRPRSTADGRIAALAHRDVAAARRRAGLPNIPLLGPAAAGIAQPTGITTGLHRRRTAIRPTAPRSMNVVVHWLKDTPLRPSPIRAPGKLANCFAVESFIDELAAAAQAATRSQIRLKGLTDPRGIEVLKRMAATDEVGQPAVAGGRTSGAVARGRGIAYIHYKHNETYVAMGMEVEVERATGRIRVERVACAHDCGLIINPDGVQRADRGQHPADAEPRAVRGGQVRPLARHQRRLGELSDPALPGRAAARDRR